MTPVTHSLVKALRTVPDFESLDDHSLLRIVGASANLFWPAGSLVFEKGSPSEALYVVLSGEIRILDTVDGAEQEVSRVGSGGSFGELSLLLQTTHTKNAEAVQDSELMVIPEESFQELLDSNQELSARFRRRVEERVPLRGEISETS
ncbi:MAG TPA: cyclic nucleotide-binding domain-containing protein [Actinomycetota bacterium]|nr:cyclic nucleotide-binding domain-containing protein [Actinomycetota bacterium]